MAIAFDTAVAVANSGGGVTSYTRSYTMGSVSNGLLLVGLRGADDASDTVTGVTYNGVPMTQVNKRMVTGLGALYLYFLLNPASGANNIVASSSSGITFRMVAASYSGVAGSGQPDSQNTGEANSAATTLSVSTTTIADNCWLMGLYLGPTVSAGANTTIRGGGDFVVMLDSNAAKSPAGSFSLNTNVGTGDPKGLLIGSFSPAVAAAASYRRLALLGVGQ